MEKIQVSNTLVVTAKETKNGKEAKNSRKYLCSTLINWQQFQATTIDMLYFVCVPSSLALGLSKPGTGIHGTHEIIECYQIFSRFNFSHPFGRLIVGSGNSETG